MQRAYRICDDVPTAFNSDFNCTTAVNLQTSSTLGDGTPVGDVEVIWYLKFKTRMSAF
jgi:hypothetical protein